MLFNLSNQLKLPTNMSTSSNNSTDQNRAFPDDPMDWIPSSPRSQRDELQPSPPIRPSKEPQTLPHAPGKRTEEEQESEAAEAGEDLTSDSYSDDEDSGEEEDDTRNSRKVSEFSWIDSGKANHAKEKLIKILDGQLPLPGTQWGLREILATLLHHRKDKRLRPKFRELRSFFL